MLLRLKRKFIRTLFHEQWSLLVCGRDGKILASIAPPGDRFWADPFPVEYNGRTFIFIEEQIGSGKGKIGYIELYSDLSYSPFTSILEKEYHLSFPNVFSVEKDGREIWYMIPESHENRTVDLYRSDDFPGKWVHEATLLAGVTAVDSVVLYHNNYWWLFTSLGDDSNPVNKNLSIFYSETFPSSQWKAHRQNPVSSGLDNSRMAGSVFFNKETGRLHRPAQNCLKDYGQKININEIAELSPLAYREKTISTILPEQSLSAVCTHTFNYSPNYLLRDIKTRKFKLAGK